eukprot:TRINITY_DN2039_c0_g1_i1.p1 TRINITY_DN2039_c0_g1~~TRINITY_DN2039_c0_g1_i1.p1  ORF type:complete len:1166 (+),score=370.32 TRINITY_DN2039_c0_g1_i1:49-3546(+)
MNKFTRIEPGKIRVGIRVRPQLELEIESKQFENAITINDTQITVQRPALTSAPKKTFDFEYIFNDETTQLEIYNEIAKPVLADVYEGYNGTILAYGPSGTGKTFTLSNYSTAGNYIKDHEGLIPRCISDIFDYGISLENTSLKVEMTYVQIYMEMLQDLLDPNNDDLRVREDASNGVFLAGAAKVEIATLKDAMDLLIMGNKNRSTAFTNLNAHSSRSHAVVILYLTQSTELTSNEIESGNVVDREIIESKLVCVDLAGSERIKKSGVSGIRAEEAKKINLSLSVLGSVVHALTTPQTSHVPYRDSKLTRLLQDSLGGNARTSMICTVGPALKSSVETVSTLQFASRARRVITKARKNITIDYKALCIKLQAALDETEQKLNELTVSVGVHEDQSLRIKELEDQLEDYKSGLQISDKLQEETNRLKDDLKLSQGVNDKLEEQIESQDNEIKNLLKELELSNLKNIELEKKQEDLIAVREDEKSEYLSKISDLEETLSSTEDKYVQKAELDAKKIVDLQMRIDEYVDELETQKLTFETEKKKLEQHLIFEYEEEIESIEKDNEEMLMRMEIDFTERLEEVRTKYEEQIRVKDEKFEKEKEEALAEQDALFEDLESHHQEEMERLEERYSTKMELLQANSNEVSAFKLKTLEDSLKVEISNLKESYEEKLANKEQIIQDLTDNLSKNDEILSKFNGLAGKALFNYIELSKHCKTVEFNEFDEKIEVYTKADIETIQTTLMNKMNEISIVNGSPRRSSPRRDSSFSMNNSCSDLINVSKEMYSGLSLKKLEKLCEQEKNRVLSLSSTRKLDSLELNNDLLYALNTNEKSDLIQIDGEFEYATKMKGVTEYLDDGKQVQVEAQNIDDDVLTSIDVFLANKNFTLDNDVMIHAAMNGTKLIGNVASLNNVMNDSFEKFEKLLKNFYLMQLCISKQKQNTNVLKSFVIFLLQKLESLIVSYENQQNINFSLNTRINACSELFVETDVRRLIIEQNLRHFHEEIEKMENLEINNRYARIIQNFWKNFNERNKFYDVAKKTQKLSNNTAKILFNQTNEHLNDFFNVLENFFTKKYSESFKNFENKSFKATSMNDKGSNGPTELINPLRLQRNKERKRSQKLYTPSPSPYNYSPLSPVSKGKKDQQTNNFSPLKPNPKPISVKEEELLTPLKHR